MGDKGRGISPSIEADHHKSIKRTCNTHDESIASKVAIQRAGASYEYEPANTTIVELGSG